MCVGFLFVSALKSVAIVFKIAFVFLLTIMGSLQSWAPYNHGLLPIRGGGGPYNHTSARRDEGPLRLPLLKTF